MNLIVTPVHSIPKDKILAYSFAADDKNPQLCALQVHLITGNSVIILYASRQEMIRLIKERLDASWNNDDIFDVSEEISELDDTLKQLYNKPIFYSFVSEQEVVTEAANYKQNN